MKTCATCINFRRASGDTWDHTDICVAQIVRSPNIIRGGDIVTGYVSAEKARGTGGICGPEGKLWVQRPPTIVERGIFKTLAERIAGWLS